MRVITGSARGMKLKTLEGLDVRPTADMVKESVFSIIQFEIENARVLDLFAGSGQLGIEALSRGASKAVFVDKNREAVKTVKENLEHTKLSDRAEVRNEDSVSFLRTAGADFDIAFLDPPYGQGLLQKVLPSVADKMSDSGVMICESASSEELPETAGEFSKYKEYKYGKIKLTVYRPGEEND